MPLAVRDDVVAFVSKDLIGVMLRSTTVLGQMPGLDSRGKMVESGLSDSVTRMVRDSAVLCRVAGQIHRLKSTDSLLQAALAAIIDGVHPDWMSIWLVGGDGRLWQAAHSGEPGDADVGSHILASLAVAKNKAFLIKEPDADIDDVQSTIGEHGSPLGTAMGVPIPGPSGCRGAIECYRHTDEPLFARSALDFTVVVAHQAGLALENLEHRERLEQANSELRRRLSGQNRLSGSSEAMEQVLDQIARVGPTLSNVLILGESGTGKELVAQSIHGISPFKDGPCVAVNCAAFSESLLESELFGHEAGAFTSASHRHIGKFECAHRGTIFLDEVGEMSAPCQAKLLRILEGHPFHRLGGNDAIKVDVRIVAATHRDLKELVEKDLFREDLYYRLRVIDIHVPPLRERGDDVVELATVFLEELRRQLGRGPRRLSDEAIYSLRTYHWPGNVRELKNAIERAVVLSRGEEVTTADLGVPRQDGGEHVQPALISLQEAEIRHIEYVMRMVDGNKTEACRILGIGRSTLYKKLEEQALAKSG